MALTISFPHKWETRTTSKFEKLQFRVSTKVKCMTPIPITVITVIFVRTHIYDIKICTQQMNQ